MLKYSALALAVCCLAMSVAVLAYPTFNAVSGIVSVPTADVIGVGGFAVAGDSLFLDDTTTNIRLLVGLSDRLEVGVMHTNNAADSTGVSAKYRLAQRALGFGWALGVTNINSHTRRADGTQVFLTATRPFTSADLPVVRLLGTMGLNYTDLRTDNALRPFVGGQLRLGDRTELAGEFQFKADEPFENAILSFVIRQRLGNGLAVEAGITNADDLVGADERGLFLGAAYTFGQ